MYRISIGRTGSIYTGSTSKAAFLENEARAKELYSVFPTCFYRAPASFRRDTTTLPGSVRVRKVMTDVGKMSGDTGDTYETESREYRVIQVGPIDGFKTGRPFIDARFIFLPLAFQPARLILVRINGLNGSGSWSGLLN